MKAELLAWMGETRNTYRIVWVLEEEGDSRKEGG
jgi:hypothetical protein